MKRLSTAVLRQRTWWRSDEGSAPAEFAMVGALLTLLTLSVLQLGLALHVRNTLVDAAAEGARYAALADSDVTAGEERTRQLIAAAVGPSFAEQVVARRTSVGGYPVAEVLVVARLPVLGLLGPGGALELTGRAAIEEVAQ